MLNRHTPTRKLSTKIKGLQEVHVKILVFSSFCLSLALGTGALGMSIASFANPTETNAELMQQWISLESQKGKLQSDWRERRQQIEQNLSLFELEQQSLQKIVQQSSDATTEVDEQRVSLLSEQSSLEAEQQQVSQLLQNLSQNMQHLMLRLPPPLQNQWQEKIALINQDAASNSEKLERLLGMFKLAEDFDKRIAINHASMSIKDKDGDRQNMMVTQIYMGLSQGWYINEDGTVYGFGKASNLGWQWFDQEEAKNQLGLALEPSTLLKIRDALDDPTTATYLSLPVNITLDVSNES